MYSCVFIYIYICIFIYIYIVYMCIYACAYIYIGFVLFCFVWFGLVWFYGISTIVGDLIPNPCLYMKTVLFQTIHFCISTGFFLFTHS